MRHFCLDVPYVLVGCKKDLRTDPGTIAELKKMHLAPVSYEQGKETAEKINAFAYIECSAKHRVRCV